MAINDIVQTIAEARVDARSLSNFVFKPAGFKVARRLAGDIETLEFYLEYMRGLQAVYEQPSGIVEVNGVQVKAVTQAVIDALNSAAIDNNTQVDTLVTVTPKIVGQKARTLADKLSDVYSLKDFYNPLADLGDYTAALQRALDSGEEVIDGGGKSYDIGNSYVVNHGNIKLQNMELRAKDIGVGTKVFNFQGSLSDEVSVTASTLFSLTVSSVAGFSKDDYIRVSSNEFWSTTVVMAETTQIESIDVTNNILYLRIALSANYNSGNSAKVSRMNLLENISFNGVRLLGADNDAQSDNGVWFEYCKDINIFNTHMYDFDSRHIQVQHSVGTRINSSSMTRTGNDDGIDYGVVIAGTSLDTIVNAVTGTSMRHFVTIGGYDGVSKHNTISFCRAFNTIDAAYDSHSAAVDVDFLYNQSSQSNSSKTQQDGIIAQCANARFIGNTLNNPRRHGLVFSPEVNAGVFLGKVGVKSANNTINVGNTSTTAGAFGFHAVSDSTSAGIDYIASDNDTVGNQATGVYIRAKNSDIRSVSITNLNSTSANVTRGVQLIADNQTISDIKINSNAVDISSNNEVVYLQGVGTGKFENWQVRNNTLEGGGTATAIRTIGAKNGGESGNTLVGCSRLLISDATSTGLRSLTPRVGSADWSGATIANGGQETISVTIDNVSYGDIVEAALSVNQQGCVVSGYMQGTNTINVTISNNTGVSKTLGACKVIATTKRIIA